MKRIEIINKVKEFYNTPGNGAGIDALGSCSYYVSDTSKCAIGCLVEDAQVLVDFQDAHNIYSVEGIYTLASNLRDEKTLSQIRPLLPEDLDDVDGQLRFLSDLQSAHDNAAGAVHYHPEKQFIDELNKRLDKLESQI